MRSDMPEAIDVAVVQLWSDKTRTPADNRVHALEMLARAAANRPDLVVLPEAVAMLCYPDGRPDFSYRDVMEAVPGPTTDSAASLAREHGVNILIGLVADCGDGVRAQNVIVAIDRTGTIIGRYEKTHEPEVCRRNQAAVVGDSLPVISFDFGLVGIFVCWDLVSPETASILTLKGARLLCFPHLIALPAARNFAVSLRARAVDNAVPVVAAGMRDAHNHNGCQEGLYPTCIIGADGNVIAQSDIAGPDVLRRRLSLAQVEVAHMAREEASICWTRHRPTELRPDLYAREYNELASRQSGGYGHHGQT
jgi:deaminated glutathione amidase